MGEATPVLQPSLSSTGIPFVAHLLLPPVAVLQDVARRVMDAGAGLGLSGLPTGNISSGDIRDAVADLVSDSSSFRSSAGVLSGVLRWEK